jgi:sortase A
MIPEYTHKTLMRFERLLLLMGAFLVCAFGALQLYRIVYARAMVQRFQVRPERTSPNGAYAALRPSTGIPDFRLWSEKRIEAYQVGFTQSSPAPVGVLRIASIGLEVPVFEGTDDLTLNRAVGHIEGSTAMGGEGNIGIAGHRDGFFRGLKDIHEADRIDLQTETGNWHYKVDRIVIVAPEDVSVLDPQGRPTLTLVTCYPFYFVGSAPWRYIVQASETSRDEHTNSERTGSVVVTGESRQVQ